MSSGEIVVISVSALVGGIAVLNMWVFLWVMWVLWVLWVLRLILFMQSESLLDAS